MTRPLDYALPGASDPLTRRRLCASAAYYVAWAIGASVGGAMVTLSVHGVREDDGWLYVASLAMGAAVGIFIGVVARRARAMHAVMTVLGAVATVTFGVLAILHYRAPRGFLWEFGMQLILALLLGAAATLIAGLAGLALTRRRAAR
jgi:hypothetical protein